MNITAHNWRRRMICSLALCLLAGAGALQVEAAPSLEIPQLYWEKSRLGDRNENVRTIQYLLRARGYKVNADGIFGAQTKSVVARFQRSHNLIADGLVGDQTWRILVVPLKRGNQGDAVRALQNQLKTTTYGDYISVDGNFGQQTEAALKEFQDANQQKADGIVGMTTWDTFLHMEEGD